LFDGERFILFILGDYTMFQIVGFYWSERGKRKMKMRFEIEECEAELKNLKSFFLL